MEGAALLQSDIAKRRREERNAMEAFRADLETFDEDAPLGDDEGGSDDEHDSDSDEDLGDDDLSDDEEDDEEEDEDEDDKGSDEGSDEEGEEGEEVSHRSDSENDSEAGLESDSDGLVNDPTTGRKRKRVNHSLTMDEKKEQAAGLVKRAEEKGGPSPKVRKNGVLSLSELRRLHKEAAVAKREADELGAEVDESDSEGDTRIEHDRILGPEDFKRIKALKTANKLATAFDKTGAKKASETGAEEMRRMLRAADKSGVADRRVNPDALAAIGIKRNHDKESRVASIMAGREDRSEFGAAKERKNKKEGGTSNKEKNKKKNLPLAARAKAAKNRRTSFVSKRVKDKQFKGRFKR